MNEFMTRLFIEQPLALPGSAKKGASFLKFSKRGLDLWETFVLADLGKRYYQKLHLNEPKSTMNYLKTTQKLLELLQPSPFSL